MTRLLTDLEGRVLDELEAEAGHIERSLDWWTDRFGDQVRKALKALELKGKIKPCHMTSHGALSVTTVRPVAAIREVELTLCATFKATVREGPVTVDVETDINVLRAQLDDQIAAQLEGYCGVGRLEAGGWAAALPVSFLKR